MEVLELIPLKKSKLKLILIESEFPINWWFDGPPEKRHDLAWNLHLISREYLELIENFINKYQPNFAVEERGSRWEEVISKDDPISVLFRNHNIPYQMVDISENAEDYLYANLDEYRSLLKQLKAVINNNNSNLRGDVLQNEFEFQKALLWKEYLKQEYIEKEKEVRFKVREAWMMMRIMNKARELKSKSLTAIFICDVRHFDGIKNYAEELGVEIEEIKIKRTPQIGYNNENSTIQSLLDKKISLFPIKIKKKEELEKICYFLDSDEIASPFEINMAYDAGFDIVVPFSKISADQVPKLVQDAIFSRKPNAPTVFFVGGTNIKEGNNIANNVIDSLVPPFECPVIIDPRGSHTTASSIVAKTLEIALMHNIEDIKGKKVVILGAGPVARIAAVLSAKLKCNTYIVETWNKSSKEFIKNLARELSSEIGEEGDLIKGKYAVNNVQKFEIIKDADIIWALAAPGIQVLSKELIIKLKNKIIIDINLVPPYGIEGLKPKDNNKEIFSTIFGVGALAVGRLKSDVEASILKEAVITKGKKIFDYNEAFKKAKKILLGEEIKISQ